MIKKTFIIALFIIGSIACKSQKLPDIVNKNFSVYYLEDVYMEIYFGSDGTVYRTTIDLGRRGLEINQKYSIEDGKIYLIKEGYNDYYLGEIFFHKGKIFLKSLRYNFELIEINDEYTIKDFKDGKIDSSEYMDHFYVRWKSYNKKIHQKK